MATNTFTYSPATVLTLDSKPRSTGGNVSIWRLNHTFSDQQAGGGYRLLHVTDSRTNRNNPTTVTFDGGHIAYDHYSDDNARLFQLEHSCNVTVRDFMGIQAGTVEWHTSDDTWQTNITFDGCRFGSQQHPAEVQTGLDLLATDWSEGVIHLTLRGCTDWTGNPIPDYDGYTEGEKK